MTATDDRTRLRAEIDRAAETLAEAGVASPRVDATALAAYALGVSQLVLAMPPPLPAGFDAEYAELVERRRLREPLQQIVGFAVFRHVRLRIEPGVFVPRPETEVVAGAAIAEALPILADRQPIVVDLCSGTGAIAASVDVEVPGAQVIAVEIDPTAAALTRANLATLGSRSSRVVEVDVADPALLAEFDATVDVVVSNPPYIPPDEIPEDPEVRVHDPARALYGGGADGLDVPRAVAAAAARLLRTGGLFVMEHGDAQGPAVRDLVAATGAFGEIQTHRDLTDRDRYVTARRRSLHPFTG
jgi:release factor glutamine methyltransferase